MLVILGRLLEHLFEKPIESGFLFLCGAALFVAAGIFGVRFIRSVRAKNGNGALHGDELAEFSRDLQGIGPPKPPRQRGEPFVAAGDGTLPAGQLRLVSTEAFDATMRSVDRRIDQVSADNREQLQRLVKVEQTCARTEADVKALPETFKALLAAQTVELQQANQKHVLAAFEALDTQQTQRVEQRFEALREELGLPKNGKP